MAEEILKLVLFVHRHLIFVALFDDLCCQTIDISALAWMENVTNVEQTKG
jgi:hypothetical protein